jgi:hypothetical protein
LLIAQGANGVCWKKNFYLTIPQLFEGQEQNCLNAAARSGSTADRKGISEEDWFASADSALAGAIATRKTQARD